MTAPPSNFSWPKSDDETNDLQRLKSEYFRARIKHITDSPARRCQPVIEQIDAQGPAAGTSQQRISGEPRLASKRQFSTGHVATAEESHSCRCEHHLRIAAVQRLGIAVPRPGDGADAHVQLKMPGGFSLELDTAESARLWHADWRADPAGTQMVLGFMLPARSSGHGTQG
jgi:hypothetical protein